jgi:pilus assembly protein CpaE
VEDVSRIVLAVEGHQVAEEIMHFLDRTGDVRIVAAASDEQQLTEAIRQLEPDVLLVSPSLIPGRSSRNGTAVLTVDTVETVRSLRRALEAGARGFYRWPDERDALLQAVTKIRSDAPPSEQPRAPVVAVYGPRGGVGTTFVAVHLAVALASRTSCVLADLDLSFADVTGALGVPAEERSRTIADLVPLGEEVGPQDVRGVLHHHPAGLEVLLAPPDAAGSVIDRACLRAVLGSLAATTQMVVLHVPRTPDTAARAGLELADRALVVMGLDVASLRAARRAGEALGIEERSWYVVNRAGRSAITPGDVERVLGRPPVAVIPADRAVTAAMDRGRVLPLRGRTGRAVRRLADRVLEDAG